MNTLLFFFPKHPPLRMAVARGGTQPAVLCPGTGTGTGPCTDPTPASSHEAGSDPDPGQVCKRLLRTDGSEPGQQARAHAQAALLGRT